MYTVTNFKNAKALKTAFASGAVIEVFSPGPFPVTPGAKVIEGPHYPKPHSFYVPVTVVESPAGSGTFTIAAIKGVKVAPIPPPVVATTG